MRMDDVFTALAKKVSLQLGPESPYYIAPLKPVKHKNDEWFPDPENPTDEEISNYAIMRDNHKRARCEECGKVLPINTKRVVKYNPESPEWLCHKCKIALERWAVPEPMVNCGKSEEDKNKVCLSCGATFTESSSGNRVRIHTKDCSSGVT